MEKKSGELMVNMGGDRGAKEALGSWRDTRASAACLSELARRQRQERGLGEADCGRVISELRRRGIEIEESRGARRRVKARKEAAAAIVVPAHALKACTGFSSLTL